jgi:4-hydroxybenzoate polyprenyltransferase
MIPMSNQIEGLFAIIAALFVLFSAMLDPKASVILAVAGLALYGIYKLTAHRQPR